MPLVYDEKSKTFTYRKDLDIFDLLFLLTPFVSLIALVKIINSLGNLSEDDTENIRKIIEEGRKQNVAEMEIEMSRDVGMGINIANLNRYEVTIGTKGKTKYMLKVKYK